MVEWVGMAIVSATTGRSKTRACELWALTWTMTHKGGGLQLTCNPQKNACNDGNTNNNCPCNTPYPKCRHRCGRPNLEGDPNCDQHNIDNMDGATFTTIICNMSPPLGGTTMLTTNLHKQDLMMVDHVTNFRWLMMLWTLCWKMYLERDVLLGRFHRKVLQEPPPGNMAKNRTKSLVMTVILTRLDYIVMFFKMTSVDIINTTKDKEFSHATPCYLRPIYNVDHGRWPFSMVQVHGPTSMVWLPKNLVLKALGPSIGVNKCGPRRMTMHQKMNVLDVFNTCHKK
jgi:hypothetical protein